MKDAIKQFEDEKIETYNEMKLAMYFGTLESVYVISRNFGFNHTRYPQFASQFLFELTHDAELGYRVTALYNKDQIALGGECKGAASCPFESFLSFLKSIRADESMTRECKPKTPLSFYSPNESNQMFSTSMIVLLGALAILSVLIGGAMGYKAAKAKPQKRVLNLHVVDQESLLGQ